jgi:hypothetical protein
MKTVYAWTDTNYQFYPQYINVSVEDGNAIVTVRGRERGRAHSMFCGDYARMEMPVEELKNILEKLVELPND